MRPFKQCVFQLQNLLFLLFDLVFKKVDPQMLPINLVNKHLNHHIFLAVFGYLFIILIVLNLLFQVIIHFHFVTTFCLNLLILRPIVKLRYQNIGILLFVNYLSRVKHNVVPETCSCTS